jgi:stearoyl-CoA desaturase (delta-9 desaturase)
MYICILSALGMAKVKKVAPRPHLVKSKTVLDDETVQAILRNRYEVMARYARTAERAYRQELAQMRNIGLCKRFLLKRRVRKWFGGACSSAYIPQRQQRFAEMYDDSQTLRIYLDLQDGLSAIRERSNRSREQLRSQLQEWCRRAEHSGINPLKEFSVRLRRYT